MLASGNVAFGARAKSDTALAREIEAAMAKQLDRTFYTIVRPARVLRELLEADPYAAFRLPPNAKRVVTFLREPYKARDSRCPSKPMAVRILAMNDARGLCCLRPKPAGTCIHGANREAFGTAVTTRTWDTVKKCSIA